MVRDIVNLKFYLIYIVGLKLQNKLSSRTRIVQIIRNELFNCKTQWYSYFKINTSCLKDFEIQINIVSFGNFINTSSKISNKTK